jgi:twitching motility protein PilT
MAQLDRFLKACADKKCSDLHIAAGMPVMVRFLGEIQPLTNQAATPEQVITFIHEILSAEQREQLIKHWELDSIYQSADGERFRMNVCKEQRGLAAVFRHIPMRIRTFSELGLPPVMEKFCLATQGLIIVTGPCRSGKSTTMASMLDWINANRNEHIITIEDPIEYMHQNKKSIISQRSVGAHTCSFANALRAALREDPDVILIGEIRDLETMSLALTAAETGHVVLTTLHTSSAPATINRVINLYPAAEQAQAQTTLAECLLGIISQQLIKNAAGNDMVAAFEVLVNTMAVANIIRSGENFKLEGMMQVGTKEGMKLMENSLEELLKAGLITGEARREFSLKESKA